MQKRGQITVFIIIGLIILVVVGLFMLVGQESSFEQDLNEAEQNAKKAVQTYVENCLKEQLEDINQLVSLQGGYYQEPPYPSDYVVDRETFEIVQPYVPYVFNQGQKTFPTRVKVEEQLALGMKDNLYNCKDLSSLPYDASIRSEAGEVTASFLNTKVSVSVSLPIVLNVGNTVININQFSIEIPSKLPKLYEVAERITDEQVQRGMQLCLTCLSRTIEEHNVHLEMTEEGRETVHIITYTLSAPAGGDVFIFAHKFSLGGEISTLLLPPVEKLEATAGYPFTYELMAYGNGLTFYDDSELFDIDEHSGTITFSPTKEDVGSEIVIVRV